MSSRPVVVVFVNRPDMQATLSDGFKTLGIDSLVVRTSDELHHVLNHERVDALVIEHALGGFLTGLEILHRMREDLLKPVTILIGNLTPPERAQASGLKIDQIADASMETEVICEFIRTAMTCSNATGLRIPAGARYLVKDLDNVRPMPQLIVWLAQFLADDQGSTAELSKKISADARITAELLRMANSTTFGTRHRIVRVADAVSFLGIRRTASLIVAASTHQMQSDLQELDEELLNWYRARSVLTACSAAAFSRLSNDVSRDHAYTLALFQDLGILIMAHVHGQRYLKLLSRFRTVPQLQLETSEQQEFSITHADVSAALLQKWDFPASMTALILDHHAVDSKSPRSLVEEHFLWTMRVGEAVANMRELPSPQRNERLQAFLRMNPAVNATEVRNCLATSIAMSIEMGALFNTPVPEKASWDQLVEQIQREIEEPGTSHALEQVANAPPDADNVDASIEAKPAKILVIEDDDMFGRVVALFLEETNVEVERWSTLRPIGEMPAGLAAVICDIYLAEGNGLKFVAELRDSGFDLPVIMISGDKRRSTVMEAIKAGANDYLAKPFMQKKLLEKLRLHQVI